MGKIKAVIFDFDMTLADSSHAIHRCINLMAPRLGLPEVSYERVLAGIGIPFEDSMRLYWGDFRQEWVDFYRMEYRSIERGEITLFPNTLSTLEKLRSAGLKLGAASNRRNVKGAMETMGIAQFMDAIIGREDASHTKPHPEILQKGLEALGVSAEETLFVGDTDIDMQTACAADVRGVGMTTGSFDAEGLTAAGAWRVCSDLSELPALIS